MTLGIVAVAFVNSNKLNISIQCDRLQPRITISVDIDPINLLADDETRKSKFKKNDPHKWAVRPCDLLWVMGYVCTLTGSVFFDVKNRLIGGLWSIRRMAPVCWFGSIALIVPFCTNLFVMKCSGISDNLPNFVICVKNN